MLLVDKKLLYKLILFLYFRLTNWIADGISSLPGIVLVYYMASPFCIEQKRNVATGDIIVHISTENVGNFLVPVPPLAEQKRIVAKTEELLSHI
jgi:restriction endonuclease S subunit